MEPALLLTKTLNSIKAECSKHMPRIDRIDEVLVANEFFKSLPDKDRLNLIKQQMEKHDITLSLLEEYHLSYVYLQQPPMSLIGPITQAFQTLWEIINELENKCKHDHINKQQ